MKKVAVIGGGMAGLTAAWHLSGRKSRAKYQVTVYQRGWRLGGKGASSRGANGRIEEHGLHVWLGFYDNAFRLMRQVYDELDRPTSDPGCPVPTFERAFTPMHHVGLGGSTIGTSQWVASFSNPGGEPGSKPMSADSAMSAVEYVRRALVLLADFASSLPDPAGRSTPSSSVVLSGSPEPPRTSWSPELLIRRAEMATMVATLEALQLMDRADTGHEGPTRVLLDRLRTLQEEITNGLDSSDDSRRAGELADLVATGIRGVLTDRLISHPDGLAAVNHLDFREWLRAHGAREATCNSPLVRGLHDLTFAYEGGDFDRPRFAAGQGLLLSRKMFFEYRGALFWRMEAGMGDIVFAPLYQALVGRGVRFEFFHRLDQLHVGADGSSVQAITFGRQAELKGGQEYQPLIRVGDLPCFPRAPLADQVTGDVNDDLELHWSDRSTEVSRRLEVGTDFDSVVLAVSIGMIPHTCGELLAASPRWRAMVKHVSTVPTQSLQLWLRPTEAELGWPHGGSTVSGYPSPFDTYASMSHLIARETWPQDDKPGTIAYFCSALSIDHIDDIADPDIADRRVRSNAVDLLSGRISQFWPASQGADGEFRWELLHADNGHRGDPLDAQYWRANTDPSDQYVQCLPGTVIHRMRSDRSGFTNLTLAGDWTDNGNNAGCIEAAVISGINAANTIRKRPLSKGVLGGYRPAR